MTDDISDLDTENLDVEQDGSVAEPQFVYGKDDDELPMWAVHDLIAFRTGVIRVHNPVPGYRYEVGGEFVAMPRAHAVKFLSGPDYVVHDEFGDVVTRMDDDVPVGAVPDLRPDQVVCAVTELTERALLLRVNRLPGGEGFNAHSGRKELEDFFIRQRQAIRNTDAPTDRAFDMPDEVIDDADRLIGPMKAMDQIRGDRFAA